MKIALITGDTNIDNRSLFDYILEKPFKITDQREILREL